MKAHTISVSLSGGLGKIDVWIDYGPRGVHCEADVELPGGDE